ncbi:MAG TPA: 30S ribosome-binding factor RbfA [Methylophilus sp.]|jgi:ribosome-binding factor A|uniref:30S ribosome-binding factor RbfA n=1 Tax=Methylophilus TaxID=16 RepID=UPI000371AA5C|nr:MULTISPECIES: 30S ribosome-binding factor RbfA [Methylophilus]AKR44342.1 ribosome-binding factor A [Methylophilus sp. TWE2]PPD12980.1 MAG: 30S ribosome-binding factor RbfA [Methylophilus sp.]HWU65911.1 30S ribosome-binding factor RbfA [Methylophilus sp.]
MAKAFSRNDRVSEQMRRELADLLMFEVKDPRVQMVTLTGVEVAGDMAHAKVFYTAQKNSKGLQAGLEKAAGFLRSQLGKRMMIRTVPQLHFVYDESIDRGMHMDKLIHDALSDTPPQE